MSAPQPLLAHNRPAPSGEVPAAPRQLSAKGRRRWRELHAEYSLSLAASDLLGQALVALDLAEECQRQIARDGVLVPGRYEGVPRAHPLAAVQRDSVRTAERLFRALDLDLAEDPGSAGRRSSARPAASPTPLRRPTPTLAPDEEA